MVMVSWLQLSPHYWTWPHCASTIWQSTSRRESLTTSLNGFTKCCGERTPSDCQERYRAGARGQAKAWWPGSNQLTSRMVWQRASWRKRHCTEPQLALWWTEWSLAWPDGWQPSPPPMVEGQMPGVGCAPFQRSKSHPDPWSVVDFHAPECVVKPTIMNRPRLHQKLVCNITLWKKINIDPENSQFLMETSLPTPICQGLC